MLGGLLRSMAAAPAVNSETCKLDPDTTTQAEPDYITCDELPGAQCSWQPRLAVVKGRKPAPSKLALNTPTSTDVKYWEAHKGDSVLYNVGLVAGPLEPEPIPVAAVDLAANSCWFQLLLDNRHELGGTEFGRIVIPCSVPRRLLELIVRSLYQGIITLGPDNVEAVYRASDAMQMPRLMEVCEHYLAATAFAADADSGWVMAVFDLAIDLYRHEFRRVMAEHFSAAAQRDASRHHLVLSHILSSQPYASDGLGQMAVLRAGHVAAWNGQGSESLLLHVLLEVQDALNPGQLPRMLDLVDWHTLQQDEVLVLVDWVLQLDAASPLAPQLKERTLRCIAQQVSGSHDRRYMVWRQDVGRLPASGTRMMSANALAVGGRRLYLCMERTGASDWGLVLCPPPDVGLYSRVTHHTLFCLSPVFSARVALQDVPIGQDLCAGAGYGSRTIISDWLRQGHYKGLSDGAKQMVVGTVATHTACEFGAGAVAVCGLKTAALWAPGVPAGE